MTAEKDRSHLSKSQEAHRREVLAEGRRKPLPSDFFEQQIRNQEMAELRLNEVKRILNGDEGLVPRERIILKIEEILLNHNLNKIDSREHQSQLQRLLNEIEKEDPDVYEWLFEADSERFTNLYKIRGRVTPPVIIGGYYTKRR